MNFDHEPTNSFGDGTDYESSVPVTNLDHPDDIHNIPVKEFTELSSMALHIMTSLAGSQLRVGDPDTIDTAYELIDAMSQDAKESILAHYDFLCDIQEEIEKGGL